MTEGDPIMKRLFLFAAVAVLIMDGAGAAAAAELPTYEVTGFPITSVQTSVVGSAHVQEASRQRTLTLDGMPASPHQIAVLAPRKRIVGELAKKPTTQPTTEGRTR
jgi:hypothetical protein